VTVCSIEEAKRALKTGDFDLAVFDVALAEGADPESEPKALKNLMAKAAGVQDFRSLHVALTTRRRAAHRAFLALAAGA